MKLYLYNTGDGAENAAEKLGCKGFHTHKVGDKIKYMPCKNHKEFLKKTKKEKPEGELDELIDYDGTMLNSKIPILDPHVTAKGDETMDKTVAMARITQDPLMRGYRVYYGEGVESRPLAEEDMSGAFGWEETEDMDADETIDYFMKELGFDEPDAENRAEEMGKDPDLDDSSPYKKKKNFVGKLRLTEKGKVLSKEEILKMAEDSLVMKSDDRDLKMDKEVSPILKRNIKALKKLAMIDGVNTSELMKMLKNE